MTDKEIARYTEKDKVCVHCGGEVNLHSMEDGSLKAWCDWCGANNKLNPPRIEVTLTN